VTLIKGMAELLERSVGPGHEIEIHFPPALSAVETDANQLELALLNLVVNARDAMPGGGAIVIAARQMAADDEPQLWQTRSTPYICLSVTDSGHGMDERTLARAAEPFFTTKGIGKGTGLGLPMVHGLAEQSGGKLILKSVLGEGTTAELWFRVSTRAVRPHASPIAERAPAERSVHRILVVDDDTLVLTNTAAMLEDLGHTIIEASSADRALDLLVNEVAVDLVITDHAMPQMTGAELAAQIRGRWPDLPIIVATGYAEWPPGIAEQVIKLAKPFDQQQLAAAVATAVQRGQSQGML
jgi:CheY-like chemotaxis protein